MHGGERRRLRELERGAQLARVAEPIVRILGQRLGDRFADREGHFGDDVVQRLRLLGEVRGEDGLCRGPVERLLPREHLVADDGERVDVGAGVEVALADQLLGRHVADRADGHPGVGESRAAVRRRRAHRRARDAEVGEHRVPFLEEDVRGLDVAVDDPHAVREPEGVRHLAQDVQRLTDGEPAVAFQAMLERLALHERHDVVVEPLAGPRAQHRQDVRVLELRGHEDLAHEARGAHVARELGRQDLHDDAALERGLGREEEAAHPAPVNLALDAVRVSQRGLQPVLQLGHGERLPGRMGGIHTR